MNIDELKQFLTQRENCEIEFKTAKGGFPVKAFWPTYSSFGNTNGGVVVLVIRIPRAEYYQKPVYLNSRQQREIMHGRNYQMLSF